MDNHILKAWSVNNNLNLLLLDAMGAKGLAARPIANREGRTVAEVFVHLHNVRMAWVEHNDKKYHGKITKLDKDAKHTVKSLKSALQQSGEAIGELLKDASEGKTKTKGFKSGVGAMLGYMISHDAHHRGQILIALKQSDIKISDKDKLTLWSEWWK